jgi:prepilin-type N-terminal cleavage/methylation domain-containing protein
MDNKRVRGCNGFTLMELITVVAILGIVAVLALPSIRQMNRSQQTKSSATQVAGALETARSRAVSEGTPQLVFVNAPSTEGGGAGCGPVLVIVNDVDRNYAISPGEQQTEISLDSRACDDVKLYAQDDTARPFPDLVPPIEDSAQRAAAPPPPAPPTPPAPPEGPEEPKKGKAPKPAPPKLKVEEAVVNGSTFPLDVETGRPVIAFSERGIPVDPSSPTSWGSGAGAIYLTDGADAVYAAVVQPMGEVKLRKYDPSSAAWQ